MKRAAMLYCADCDAPRFKVLASRDQLPFLTSDEDEHFKRGPYTLAHAFLLRLTLDLIGADVRKNPLLTGVPASTAEKIISNVSIWAEQELETPQGDYWVGQLIVRQEPADDHPIEFNSWFFGRASELPARIEEECLSDPLGGAQSVVRVNIVNAARAASFVRTRAEELGLTEAQIRGCDAK